VDSRVEEAAEIVQQVGLADKKKYLGEMGLDAVIILPESQKAFDYGMNLLKNHGKLVLVSFPKKGFHLSSEDIVFRDISVVGSLIGSRKTLKEMLEFSAKHNIRPVIKRYPLSKLNELVDDYSRGSGGKLIVDMSLDG
jgi:propanol-preferring alcohol dehydrogenase